MISISLSKQKRQAYRRYWKFIFILEYYIYESNRNDIGTTTISGVVMENTSLQLYK